MAPAWVCHNNCDRHPTMSTLLLSLSLSHLVGISRLIISSDLATNKTMSTMNENSHVSTSNPLQYDLGRWKLFLEATESSKSFDKPTMLQLVYNLFITLQRCPNTDQPESLGVAVLIRGLKILDKYCKTNKKNVVDCEDLKVSCNCK